MARLPQPGSDNGTWGGILNDFLSQSHKADGTLRDGVVGASALAPNAVQGALSSMSGTDGQVLVRDAASAVGAKWGTVNGTGVQINADWNATSGAAQILNKPVLSGVATSGSYSDLSDKPTIPAAQVSVDWNATTGIAQILNKPTLSTVARTGDYNDLINKPAAGSSTPVATTSATGTITLTGDLAGTGAAPTVAKVNGVAVTGTPTSGQVLTATSGTAASWQTVSGAAPNPYIFTYRSVNTANVTADYSETLFVDTTSTGVTVTLPAPKANSIIRVKRMTPAGNGLQVAAPAGSYIDATTVGTDTLNVQFDSREYWSDGTNWYR